MKAVIKRNLYLMLSTTEYKHRIKIIEAIQEILVIMRLSNFCKSANKCLSCNV